MRDSIPLLVEVKIQRHISRAGSFVIHSFLFRMLLARAVSLRKIVTGERQSPCGEVSYATHPLTHRFTVAASLHRATIAGPGNVVTEVRISGTSTARAPHSHPPAIVGDGPEATARPGSARGRVHAVRSGDAVAAVRAVRDERSHGPAPTHDSLRRNDEAAGHARALCDAASRISPTARDISRRRGEQTRHTSPSNTVMRLTRI